MASLVRVVAAAPGVTLSQHGTPRQLSGDLSPSGCKAVSSLAICGPQRVASQGMVEHPRCATSRPGLGKSNNGIGGGAGLLDRPKFDQSQLNGGPSTEEGGDIGLLKRMMKNRGGDKYRVLLLDHEKHTESGVTKVLPTVVPSVTAEDARRAFHESKELGAGLVTLAIKEHAEFYAQQMARHGLRSTIAPDGDTV
eukprot:TRINITY_DN17117_c0_g1_i1.p1 TRINITY_DN17117_c0_g1~~TRINITY_DN17117_c0_g1_i1.p1  ORF type:complete len:195 (+),score=33.58 TRINITY_DN17117_c0_g1_i1:273-857(+)